MTELLRHCFGGIGRRSLDYPAAMRVLKTVLIFVAVLLLYNTAVNDLPDDSVWRYLGLPLAVVASLAFYRRARRNRLSLDEPDQVFRTIAALHSEERYAEGATIARAFIDHHGHLPVTAVGLWIGINGARCAIKAAPYNPDTHRFVLFVLREIEQMEGVELSETCGEYWVAPRWDERADRALTEFRQFVS